MSDRRHASANAVDATDIPTVPTSAMAIAIGAMIGTGHGMMLVNGANPQVRRQIEAAFWHSFDGDRITGNATLIRFWHLAGVMTARRLKSLFLDHGYSAFAPLGSAAANLRLNVTWGFKVQHLVSVLTANPQSEVESIQRLAA